MPETACHVQPPGTEASRGRALRPNRASICGGLVLILTASLFACSSPLPPARSEAEASASLLLDPTTPEFRHPAAPVSLVRLETSRGEIVIEVVRERAPLGADRFVNLVRHGYYDDARFFRVRPGRFVQFGVHGDPAIAQAWRQATFLDDPFRESNQRGTVTFAFGEANGRTTQVFINLTDNSATYDAEPFVPFGRVIEGLELVDDLNDQHGEGPGGIRAGRQDPFFEGGNAWLDERFPGLDLIRRATVLPKHR